MAISVGVNLLAFLYKNGQKFGQKWTNMGKKCPKNGVNNGPNLTFWQNNFDPAFMQKCSKFVKKMANIWSKSKMSNLCRKMFKNGQNLVWNYHPCIKSG